MGGGFAIIVIKLIAAGAFRLTMLRANYILIVKIKPMCNCIKPLIMVIN
jgi:hypothetical protein